VIAKASGGGIQEAKDGGPGAMDSLCPRKAQDYNLECPYQQLGFRNDDTWDILPLTVHQRVALPGKRKRAGAPFHKFSQLGQVVVLHKAIDSTHLPSSCTTCLVT